MPVVIHGMQEARGSSPLSSTALQKQISNTEPMALIAVEGQNEGQALGWLTSAAPGDGGVCPAAAVFGSAQEVMSPARSHICASAGSIAGHNAAFRTSVSADGDCCGSASARGAGLLWRQAGHVAAGLLHPAV